MKHIKIYFLFAGLILFVSCKKYLDVVPDDVATIENAFSSRSSAEKFLFTCYSYMPKHGDFNSNPAFSGGDEIWYMYPSKDVGTNFWSIARGDQNANSPYGDFWTGSKGGTKLYQGLRDINIFLENIHKVRDMDQGEKDRWINEVTFLKAYYHFYLVRNYGPIPLIKTNLPISSGSTAVQVYRDPVDSCFSYIVGLLDQVIANDVLTPRVSSEISELGRITMSIVKAFKAKVLVYAASPLFNGNTEFSSLKDDRNIPLFNPNYDANKWVLAAQACKDAIDYCEANGYGLQKFTAPVGGGWNVTPPVQAQLDVKAAVTEKLNNIEVIWANSASRAKDVQRYSMPLISAGTSSSGPKGIIAPPIKMAELFYTKNGVPIQEDKTWDYPGRYLIKKALAADKYVVKENEETVKLHFDREPRFYAGLGFDRGMWFGNWVNNFNADAMFFVKARRGETAARQGISNYSITGYWPKKLVSIGTVAASDGNVTGSNQVDYSWPEMRMADLYLLYAEALNEVSGPTTDVYDYINKVRTRANIPTVQTAWTNFAYDNSKHTNKTGLRDIIHQERLIELAFEGHRLWDLKRWKEAHIVLNAPIKGWDIEQADMNYYYKEVILYNQTFKLRDYFWPIALSELLANKKLVQNPGW